MTTAMLQLSTRLRFLASAGALLAFAALTACGTTVTPTVPPTVTPTVTPTVAQVSGHAVEIVETGTGDATVVFESGFGNDWRPWRQVASEVARHARVFAYSRPGYGRSDPSMDPRDAAHIVENLRALLVARGYSPPYVLVGHSFGGTYMELFAKAHPDEVAALVLVDPRHRDFSAACEEAGIAGCVIPDSVVRSLPPVQIAELEAFAQTSDEIDAAGTFGSHPVRVLTATSHGLGADGESLWVSMLGSLADEAEDGEQIVYPGASHNLEVERADEVADVIVSVLPTTGI